MKAAGALQLFIVAKIKGTEHKKDNQSKTHNNQPLDASAEGYEQKIARGIDGAWGRATDGVNCYCTKEGTFVVLSNFASATIGLRNNKRSHIWHQLLGIFQRDSQSRTIM
jgi:hypothetical protein